MKIRLDIICGIFSGGLDIIESQVFGATGNHCLRLAVLSVEMGKRLGYSREGLLPLATAALFHDNSLSQHIAVKKDHIKTNLREHCKTGKNNLSWLPFAEEAGDFVLYHHERADGSGAFGKKKGDFPRQAAILSLLDYFDLDTHLQTKAPGDLPLMKDIIRNFASKGFDKDDTWLLADILTPEMFSNIKDDKIQETAQKIIPQWEAELRDEIIAGLGDMFARIIDFKSHFTNAHTKRIADAMWLMSGYYGYNHETKRKLYVAASLHDIGKILIPTDILEKPDKLTKEEFAIMKHHMDRTYELLSLIPDCEDIASWAANHHEKLDGNGYPKGKKAAELDFNSRLMACIDIWEALTAHRPYQKIFYNHKQALEIMKEMAANNFIDAAIVADIDKVLAGYDGRDLPSHTGDGIRQ
jgi:HD-GYP domain-containing protein (c-di-GMP phosphodiesterase class II)